MIKLYYQNCKVGKMDIKVKNLYYLGPEGSYAQSAVKQFVSDLKISAENFIPLNPITRILQSIDEDKNAIAVLPIENSIEGIVRETIDNIIRLEDTSVKICAETVIPVCHCLMSKSENKENITHILSHPQALAQCSGYLCKNFPKAVILKTASTSEAADITSQKDGHYAAIAGENASELYGLNILDKGINDEKDNKTRFILLSREKFPVTEDSRTSVFFTVKNEPGSLVQVLNIFQKFNINMFYIESRPSRKKMGEYNFFVNLEGHVSDKNISAALNLAERITNKISVLGSYSVYSK